MSAAPDRYVDLREDRTVPASNAIFEGRDS